MAYNFRPLAYNPFQYESTGEVRPTRDDYTGGWVQGPQYRQSISGPAWDEAQQNLQRDQFQDYSGEQFKSLFDAVNKFGVNPMMSGEAFGNVPQYSPQGTRADYTSPIVTTVQDDPEGRAYSKSTGGVFNQKGYLDEQFGNINDYLSKMGSFFGGLGPRQQILANAPGQGPMPTMPSIGRQRQNLNLGGGANINNPFPSFGIGAGGGWGTPPTSLFGAGANATIP